MLQLALLAGIGLLCLAPVVFVYLSSVVARDRGVEVSAVVTGVHDSTGRGDVRYVEVTFTTPDGRRVSAWDTADVAWSPEPKFGQTIRVRYDPQNPWVIYDTKSDDGTWTWAILAIAAAAVFWVTAVIGWVQRQRILRRRFHDGLLEAPGLMRRWPPWIQKEPATKAPDFPDPPR